MPKLIDVKATASLSGQVALINYGKLNQNYFVSLGEEWSVEDLTTEEAEEFRLERLVELRKQVAIQAQEEFDGLLEKRAEFDAAGFNNDGGRIT